MLMKQRNIDEPQAYRWLRRRAMNENKRIADIAAERARGGQRGEGAEVTTGPVFRIGLLRLTDSAPLIIARERGYFAAEDIEVALSLEPSWANIADKLAYGLLDGAMMLPPLALALGLGLSGGGGPEAIIVPAALSLNGNTVTLAERWAAPVLARGALGGRGGAAVLRADPRRGGKAGSRRRPHVFDA